MDRTNSPLDYLNVKYLSQRQLVCRIMCIKKIYQVSVVPVEQQVMTPHWGPQSVPGGL